MSRRYTAGPCDTCGYTTNPSRSQAQAVYGLRRHSCQRQRARFARADRVTTRKADTGIRRDCTCPIANHTHGTHVAYVADKCRCRPCRDASATYENNRQRQRAYGHHAYVDAEPARNHLRTLGEQGMGWKRVAAAAGLDTSTVWKLIYGDPGRSQAPSKRIRPATQAKILAVTLDLAEGARVDGTGTRRRLQALVATGWSQTRLASRLGMTSGNLTPMLHDRRGGCVTVARARAVTDLYDELWDQAPTADNRWFDAGISHAKTAARRHGWVVPLAWDEDTIDDPEAVPNLGHTSARRAGRPVEDLVEDAEWFLLEVDAMATADQVAHRLHIGKEAMQRALRRAGRLDLLERLNRNTELAGHGVRRSA